MCFAAFRPKESAKEREREIYISKSFIYSEWTYTYKRALLSNPIHSAVPWNVQIGNTREFQLVARVLLFAGFVVAHFGIKRLLPRVFCFSLLCIFLSLFLFFSRFFRFSLLFIGAGMYVYALSVCIRKIQIWKWYRVWPDKKNNKNNSHNSSKQFKNRLFALNCAHMLLLFSFENSAKLRIH